MSDLILYRGFIFAEQANLAVFTKRPEQQALFLLPIYLNCFLF